jgi:uncharacterized protein (DUF1330 family)
MTAYLIAEMEVTNSQLLKDYLALSAPCVTHHGGRFLARGGKTDTLEGAPAKRVVVVAFDTVEAARRFWESPEYKAARTIRLRAAESRFIVVEGLPDA